MENNEKLILVVDDESSIRRNISDLLTPLGYSVIVAEHGDEAILKFREEHPGLVILDINLPNKDGLQVLGDLKILNKDVPVIMFTAFGTSERAIKAMKSGAYDYIEKPFELDEFLLIVERAFQFGNLLKEVQHLRTMIDAPGGTSPEDDIIGKSPAMRDIYKLIGRVASSDATILIQG
jgi:two-component system response regulator AtoC